MILTEYIPNAGRKPQTLKRSRTSLDNPVGQYFPERLAFVNTHTHTDIISQQISVNGMLLLYF